MKGDKLSIQFIHTQTQTQAHINTVKKKVQNREYKKEFSMLKPQSGPVQMHD